MTRLVGDAEPPSTARDYRDLEEALHDAARAAGSIVTDDLIAGKTDVSIKLVLDSMEGEALATIEASAIVARRSSTPTKGGSDRLIEV